MFLFNLTLRCIGAVPRLTTRYSLLTSCFFKPISCFKSVGLSLNSSSASGVRFAKDKFW